MLLQLLLMPFLTTVPCAIVCRFRTCVVLPEPAPHARSLQPITSWKLLRRLNRGKGPLSDL